MDRIDRYSTQKIVDDYLFEELINTKEYKSVSGNEEYKHLIQNFENYKVEKFDKAQNKKYSGDGKKIFSQDYLYMKYRFVAIEKAIVHFLGENELNNIIKLYEEEMTRRIIVAREHH
ncbi:MAG: hypothetical protein AB7S78_11850 [Candidatus Omnitrophota bacterium]